MAELADCAHWSVVLATVTIVLGVIWALTYGRQPRKGLPPCESGWLPWLGCAIEFGKAPLHFIADAKQKHGPVFTVLAAGKRLTFLTEAEDFQYFFKSGCADFQKAVQQPVCNTASISAESFYRSHTKIHDAVKGALTPALLPPLGKELNETFSKNILQWGDEGEGELASMVRTSMYKGVLDNLFGHNALGTHTDDYQTLEKHFVNFDDQFEYGSQLPGFLLRDWSASKKWLLDFFRDIVDQREKKVRDTSAKTLLDILMETVDRADAPNFALLMMWASLANAIPITFWTLAMVLSRPNVMKELKQEVISVLGTPTSDGHIPELGEKHLLRLRKVKAAILEGIRLRSPGAIARGVKEPFKVCGYTIPVGDLLMMSPYWAHRNPKFFPDPDTFSLERWTDAPNVDLEKNIFMDGFVAFGGGRYQCPGRWFALMEIQIYVAQILYLYDIELTGPVPQNSPLHLVGTQQPEGPCHFRFKRRR